jgi:myo-inositol-1(or 4)-monophosphatase
MSHLSPTPVTAIDDPAVRVRVAAAQVAVRAQTELLHRELGRAASQWKDDGTRVTSADLAISENIFAALRAAFPADELLSEELGDGTAAIPLRARFAWVLDPIDGTNNYAQGVPFCAIALALLEHGVPIYGVVYDAARRVVLHGGPGCGAWEEDRPVRVAATGPRPYALLGFHSPMKTDYAPHAELLVRNFKIRALGSSTLHLAYVGAGLFDGVVDHNVKVWDIAAAVPIVQGAGGEVHYLQKPLFPLRVFDLQMPRVPFWAGHAAICTRLGELLEPRAPAAGTKNG